MDGDFSMKLNNLALVLVLFLVLLVQVSAVPSVAFGNENKDCTYNKIDGGFQGCIKMPTSSDTPKTPSTVSIELVNTVNYANVLASAQKTGVLVSNLGGKTFEFTVTGLKNEMTYDAKISDGMSSKYLGAKKFEGTELTASPAKKDFINKIEYAYASKTLDDSPAVVLKYVVNSELDEKIKGKYCKYLEIEIAKKDTDGTYEVPIAIDCVDDGLQYEIQYSENSAIKLTKSIGRDYSWPYDFKAWFKLREPLEINGVPYPAEAQVGYAEYVVEKAPAIRACIGGVVDVASITQSVYSRFNKCFDVSETEIDQEIYVKLDFDKNVNRACYSNMYLPSAALIGGIQIQTGRLVLAERVVCSSLSIGTLTNPGQVTKKMSTAINFDVKNFNGNRIELQSFEPKQSDGNLLINDFEALGRFYSLELLGMEVTSNLKSGGTNIPGLMRGTHNDVSLIVKVTTDGKKVASGSKRIVK